MKRRMAFLTSRADSSKAQFKRRTPAAVLKEAEGRTILIAIPSVGNHDPLVVEATISKVVKFSLRTSDEQAANFRRSMADIEIEKYFSAIERGSRPVTWKTLNSYAGEVYDHFVKLHEENPGKPNAWAYEKALNRASLEGRIRNAPAVGLDGTQTPELAVALFGHDDLTEGVNSLPATDRISALEDRFGLLTGWIAAREGVELTHDDRITLLRLVGEAVQRASWQLKRNSLGDYSPDPEAARYPPLAKAATSLDELFAKWQESEKPSASTLSTWKGVLKSLKAHVGDRSTNIRRIVDDDLIAWTDALAAQGLAPKTIRDSHLAAAKALFRFAKRKKLVAGDPTENVRVTVKRKAGEGRVAYRNADVAKLLALARKQTKPELRWLPFLAWQTGSRIGEVAQLCGERVYMQDGHHVMHLRPAEDGGTFKNDVSERIVPIHPVLLADGFLAFVRSRGAGPLFYGKSSGDPTKRHASKGVTNRVAAWI